MIKFLIAYIRHTAFFYFITLLSIQIDLILLLVVPGLYYAVGISLLLTRRYAAFFVHTMHRLLPWLNAGISGGLILGLTLAPLLLLTPHIHLILLGLPPAFIKMFFAPILFVARFEWFLSIYGHHYPNFSLIALIQSPRKQYEIIEKIILNDGTLYSLLLRTSSDLAALKERQNAVIAKLPKEARISTALTHGVSALPTNRQGEIVTKANNHYFNQLTNEQKTLYSTYRQLMFNLLPGSACCMLSYEDLSEDVNQQQKYLIMEEYKSGKIVAGTTRLYTKVAFEGIVDAKDPFKQNAKFTEPPEDTLYKCHTYAMDNHQHPLSEQLCDVVEALTTKLSQHRNNIYSEQHRKNMTSVAPADNHPLGNGIQIQMV